MNSYPPPFAAPAHRAHLAADAFGGAYRRGRLRRLAARLRGRDARLESFAHAARGRGPLVPQPERLRDIPLDAVRGSVGRCHDYTRDLLPLRASDEERWTAVYRLSADDGGGLPPIRVRRLGDRYYVEDGHHRVSVARWHGQHSIEAYVTEFRPADRAAIAPPGRPRAAASRPV